MLRKILLIVSLSGLLAGCALPDSKPAPTPYPADYLPTVIYLTAESINATILTQTAAVTTPTETPTETPILDTPTPLPTATITPAPDIPLAAIQIKSPGPASKVASPLEVRIVAVSGKSDKVELALFGEDGRLIGRTVRALPGPSSGIYLFVKIPFEIRAAAEVGILQISLKDQQGRLQSLNTVRVLLVSTGDSQTNPPGNNIYERVTLLGLPARSTVSGGVLKIEGQFLPFNDRQVVVELVSNDGKSLGLRVLNFSSLGPQDFNTTISYKVSAPTQARLFIRQPDNVLDGPVYVYSQELTLDP
ncbi:MAG: hypothetical protein HYR70_04110 [Chloroflexi bacterium]|nr:hypothetical protein [Chloroflexota bacterium]MBI1856330.1 hypothetical protein [Chloroflexota bacterium]MBI3340741.1 hypothetical protein [Chloroflexota bacterium]